MHIEQVHYEADGRSLVGQLAWDDAIAGPRPGVLVAHEGPGLDANARDRAVRLADLGYATFALDYHGGGVPLPRDTMMERLGPLMADASRIRELGRAGLSVLVNQEFVDRRRIAALGFCFGGTLCLELARDGADLNAVVGFHSGLEQAAPMTSNPITPSVLVCIGAADPIIPSEQRRAFEEEMESREVADWQMLLLGTAGHSFTNPAADGSSPGVSYDAVSDERSWKAMVDILARAFSP